LRSGEQELTVYRRGLKIRKSATALIFLAVAANQMLIVSRALSP
jgi:hypothetical protein